ncbi:MAG TPA: hypothetical protein PKM36_10265 [Propionibacteriaceae bacterium]|nr:hypothetical protein [Propionibacteriaceae bacterium]
MSARSEGPVEGAKDSLDEAADRVVEKSDEAVAPMGEAVELVQQNPAYRALVTALSGRTILGLPAAWTRR